MPYDTDTYLTFVVLGVVLVIAVGQFVTRSGQVYLEEVFPDPRVASSVSKLLTVMFYLFALGVLGIISTMDVPVEGPAQTIITKLGVIMLVLGIVFGGTMLVLSRIRARRREEEEEEAMMAAAMHNNHEPATTDTVPPTNGPTDAKVVQPTRPPTA